MKSPMFVQAVEKAIETKMAAVDKLIENLVEPLADVGSPEKVMNKKYEDWTPQDLATAIKIYGQGDRTPLTNLIFNKTYERVKKLEATEEL